ncbi:MAG: M20/M25/M40 family metallo-hydrolase [Puniceicoccales bacterium]|jgi:acetylornithine deacetylase/succinyl-diaminopimelate desuccinylase-like protein|nr:M20/M25/M40 family metallo-hydrolase [Puniceicoccales bacterium]
MDWKNFLRQLVALRTVCADPAMAGEFARAEALLSSTLASLGFATRTFSAAGRPPIVLGSRGPGDAPLALLLYGHYDVQPAGPGECWSSDPFTLVERDGSCFGRGVADDKGPICAMLAALDEAGDLSRLRIRVVFEGGEEVGSPGLESFLRENRSLLRSDAVLVLDTGCPGELRPALTTALRGVIPFEIHLRTGERDLHSGYGGCVANAIQELVRLCATLHGEDGSVPVPGFYDGIRPASGEEMAAVEGEDFPGELGVGALQSLFPALPRRAVHTLLPSLEFNGIAGGYAGPGSKTVIPAEAVAKCTVRTVAGQDPRAICRSVERFLLGQGQVLGRVSVHFSDPAPAYGLDLAATDPKFSHLFRVLERSVEKAFGQKPLHRREGGSIGVVGLFREVLGVDSLLLGTVPPGARIHAPDENWSWESFSRTRQALVQFLRSADSLS